MASTKQYQYDIELKTDPGFIKIEKLREGIFRSLFIKDSLFDFYPVMRMEILDDASIFMEDNLFTERLDFDVSLFEMDDDQERGPSINHKFCWADQKFSEPYGNDFISGVVSIDLVSEFKLQDYPKSKSFKSNISNIARQIISKYSFPDEGKAIISSTSNIDTWYQTNVRDSIFLESLARVAYSPSSPNSPFYTFINSKGEYHFSCLDDLFSGSSEIELQYDPESAKEIGAGKVLSKQNIMTYRIVFNGLTENLENYKKKIYNIDEDLSWSSKEYDLSKKLSGIKLGQNKYPLRRAYLDDTRQIVDFGLVNGTKQKNMLKGWTNSQFQISTAFPFRMVVVTKFNSDLVAGRVLTTKFPSLSQDKDNEAIEYNGKWLVLESVHSLDGSGNMMTSCLLGKNSLNIYRDHKFSSDFI